MVSIEQVRLLESRVNKAIDYVEQVNEENTLLKSKLDSYQKRIDELEVLIQRFKEDQGKIEDGILAALDRLNKFEDAMDKGISKAKSEVPPAPKRPVAAPQPVPLSETPVDAADEAAAGPVDPLLAQDDADSAQGGNPDGGEPELGIF